jgi:hypothetical protein
MAPVLTPKQLRIAKYLNEGGMAGYQLAKLFCVNPHSVYDGFKRNGWIMKRKIRKESYLRKPLTDEKREIARLRASEWYKNNKERHKLRSQRPDVREKDRILCKRYYHANKLELREKAKLYRSVNSDKVSESKKKWYKANKERLNLQSIERYYNNIESAKIYRHTHYLNNKEIYKEKARVWAKAHPEVSRASVHRRNARLKSIEGTFTAQQWNKLVQICGDRCLKCNATNKKLTIDHVVPISKGGTNWISNIQPLCLSCNSGKRDTAIDYRNKSIVMEIMNYG